MDKYEEDVLKMQSFCENMDKMGNDTSCWTQNEQERIRKWFDKELKDYVAQIDRQRTLENWDEERYHKELQKHPCYRQLPPRTPKEMSEFQDKLGDFKLRSQYKTLNELAQVYKEDGNKYYQNKEYSLAEYNFAKGINIANECGDEELLAQLHNNRALAFFKMSMYSQSLEGCKQAIKIKFDFLKPLHIAAKCCYRIKDYDQCIKYCDEILMFGAKDNDANKEIASLKAKAVKSNATPKSKNLKDKIAKKKILDAIKVRNIKLDDSDIFYESQAIFRVPVDHVHLDEANFLVWPVFLRIIEYDQSILIQDFHEIKSFAVMLKDSLKEPPMKDNKQYELDKLNVYFDGDDGKSYKIDIRKPLAKILKQDKFIVRHGAPCFDVVVADSITERSLLSMTEEQKRTLGRL